MTKKLNKCFVFFSFFDFNKIIDIKTLKKKTTPNGKSTRPHFISAYLNQNGIVNNAKSPYVLFSLSIFEKRQ